MLARYRCFVDWASEKRHLRGLSLLRVTLGAAILYRYLACHGPRHFLFGPNGVVGHEFAQHTFSLYAYAADPVHFDVLYHAGIAIAFLWVLGYRTRLLTPLNLVFYESLNRVAPDLVDGGDNIARLLLVFACFADVGAHFSIAEARRRAVVPGSIGASAGALIHNAAVLCMALQVCVVYTVAGLTKVQGETWRNGTALYYAWRADEFFLPGVSEHLYANASLLTLLCYVTVFFQVSFPLLVFLNPYARRAAVVMGVGFHLGIGLVMGLQTFAIFMIAADLALINDAEYRQMSTVARRLWQAALARARLQAGVFARH